jgi:hypothetical protein
MDVNRLPRPTVVQRRNYGDYFDPYGGDPAERTALTSNSANTRDIMKCGMAAALTLLLGCLTPTVEAQTSPRIYVVVVDDLRFKPSETRNAEQLLALLRDEVLTKADLVGIVSTGPSGVATDLHSAADPQSLNDSIRRIANGRPLPVVEPAPGSPARSAESRRDAHVAFLTATDVVRNLAKLDGASKHFVFVSSADTAATALEAAVTDPGGELARDVAELASVARLGNVTMRVVDAGDLASANVLRPLK